jgi:hypothetical protein
MEDIKKRGGSGIVRNTGLLRFFLWGVNNLCYQNLPVKEVLWRKYHGSVSGKDAACAEINTLLKELSD